MKYSIRILAVCLLFLSLVCGSSVSAFEFKTVHVPGGEVSDAASLAVALGGDAAFDMNSMSLFADVILDHPLIITAGEYNLNGAGCVITRGFADGDLIVVRSGASLQLGNNAYAGDGAAITVSGGVLTEKNEDGTVNRTAYEGLFDPDAVTGSLVRLDGGKLTLATGGVLTEQYTSDRGGGVFVAANGQLVLDGGTILDCGTKESGGGIYVEKDGEFSFLSGQIKDCYAENGGGIYIGGKAQLDGGKIVSCSAGENGGGIYAAVPFGMTGCSAEQNSAKNGGGLYVAADMKLSGGSFSENNAVLGGALYNTAKLNIAGVYVGKNTATDGAGIWNDGQLTITEIYLSENIATQNGGGIYNGSDGECTLTGGTYSSNKAVCGGATFNIGTVYAESGSFLVNSAEYGAGICNLGKLVLRNSIYFSGNNTLFLAIGNDGGGMLTVEGKLTAPTVAILIPGRNENGTVLLTEYVLGGKILDGSEEAIKAASAQFSVKESDGKLYAVDKNGCLKKVIPLVENPWIWICGGGMVVIITAGISVFVFRKKKGKSEKV